MMKPNKLTSADFVLLFVACCHKMLGSAEGKEPVITAKELREGTKDPLAVTALRLGSTVCICCEFKGEPREEKDGSFGEIQTFLLDSKAVSMTGKLKRYRTKHCTRLVVKTDITVKCGGRCRGEDGNETQLKGEKKLTAFELRKPTMSFKDKMKETKLTKFNCWNCSAESSIDKTEMKFDFVGNNLGGFPTDSCPQCSQTHAGRIYTVSAKACPIVLLPGTGTIECRVSHVSKNSGYLFAQSSFNATGQAKSMSAYHEGGKTGAAIWIITGLGVIVFIALAIVGVFMFWKREQGKKAAGSQASQERAGSQASEEGPSSGSGSKTYSSTTQATSEA